MPIQVKLPNGAIGSFPDNMSHDDIEAVLQKQFPVKPQSFGEKLLPNIGAGIASSFASTANLPYELAKHFSQHPESWVTPEMAEHVPHFQETNYGKAFGLREAPTMSDKAIQLAAGLASPSLAGLGVKALTKAPGYASKILNVASELPLTQKMASKSLNLAKSLAEQRNVEGIKIGRDLLKEAKDFLPKNKPTQNLLKSAKNGDYQSLFTLQSDVGKAARQLTKSASGAERLHGFQAHDLRQRILDAMKTGFKEAGHEDIGMLMSKGQNKYRQYKYLSEKIYPKAKKAGVALGAAVGVPLSVGALIKAAQP